MTDSEDLRDIPGYEKLYAVTPDGRVWSHTSKWRRNGIWLKASLNYYGYPVVCLHKDRKPNYISVHRLVAQTFVPNPDNLPQVNHIDGDKTNNHVENLEWCTAQDNIRHAYKTGLVSRQGEGNGRATITMQDANDIRLFVAKGISRSDVARVYKMTTSNIGRIVTNKGWIMTGQQSKGE